MRLENILVAADFSPSADSVHRWAVAVARRFRGRITLLNVDESDEFRWPPRTLQRNARLMRLLRDRAEHRQRQLAAARGWFEQRDIPTTVEAAVGPATDRILDHIRSHDVDVVIIGRRGARLLVRNAIGATTKRVLRRTSVPTLVVPREAQTWDGATEPFGGKRIISATNFSPACRMALDATLELAAAVGAQVDCVHVVRLPTPFFITPAEWPEIVVGETREELEHLHAEDLSEHIGPERARRCSPCTTIGTSVSESLREVALEIRADLIALPSHSSGRERPPRFGSTTERVVRVSPVPCWSSPFSTWSGTSIQAPTWSRGGAVPGQ
jgi:CPA2 family monovalent cation:H+ antiporter-2